MSSGPLTGEDRGFGLYVHWPFCQSKCPYCDFNSHVAARVDQNRWARAFEAEIERVGAETPGRVLRSVFFGGGTPSLMEPAVVNAVLRKAFAVWSPANDIEVTLEANPTSVEAGRFAGYRDAGVNRVSLGVQALSDPDLKALGRRHTVAEALQAFDLARHVFDRVSFDLIYARQNQSLADWERELGLALSLAADHLSLYQLTVEDGTAFGDRLAVGGLRGLPGEDQAADMFALTQDLTEAAGYPAYEVSNHAVPGEESRHNRLYWTGGDYVGLGPGAHGRLTLAGQRLATVSPKAPAAWLQRVEMAGNGEQGRDELSRADQYAEAVMMGLRLKDGVSLHRLQAASDRNIDNKISMLTEIGMVEIVDGNLRTTTAGRPVLNAILRQLLTD